MFIHSFRLAFISLFTCRIKRFDGNRKTRGHKNIGFVRESAKVHLFDLFLFPIRENNIRCVPENVLVSPEAFEKVQVIFVLDIS